MRVNGIQNIDIRMFDTKRLSNRILYGIFRSDFEQSTMSIIVKFAMNPVIANMLYIVMKISSTGIISSNVFPEKNKYKSFDVFFAL